MGIFTRKKKAAPVETKPVQQHATVMFFGSKEKILEQYNNFLSNGHEIVATTIAQDFVQTKQSFVFIVTYRK